MPADRSGSEDVDEPPGERVRDAAGIERRDVLNAATAVGVGAIAGRRSGVVQGAEGSERGDVEETDRGSDVDVTAGPVALRESAREKGYRLRGGERYERTVEGLAYESVLVAYGGPPAAFGLLAVPAVALPERPAPQRAPDAGAAAICATAAGRRLLATMGVVRADETWAAEYERFAANRGAAKPRLLGESAEMVSLIGRTEEETVVLAQVSRVVHEGDVVFAVSARGRALDGRDVLLGDEDAVYPMAAQPSWGDWHVGVCRDVVRAPHGPLCGDGPTVAIEHPVDGEVVTGPAGATQHGGGTVETGIDERPYALVRPRASASRCVDHLEWAYRVTGEAACGREPGRWYPMGGGEATRVKLHDCGCGTTTYELRVRAVDEDGAGLATAVTAVGVDLWGC